MPVVGKGPVLRLKSQLTHLIGTNTPKLWEHNFPVNLRNNSYSAVGHIRTSTTELGKTTSGTDFGFAPASNVRAISEVCQETHATQVCSGNFRAFRRRLRRPHERMFEQAVETVELCREGQDQPITTPMPEGAASSWRDPSAACSTCSPSRPWHPRSPCLPPKSSTRLARRFWKIPAAWRPSAQARLSVNAVPPDVEGLVDGTRAREFQNGCGKMCMTIVSTCRAASLGGPIRVRANGDPGAAPPISCSADASHWRCTPRQFRREAHQRSISTIQTPTKIRTCFATTKNNLKTMMPASG